MTGAERWASALAGWAIPEEILESAAESPWTFPVDAFEDSARRALVAEPTPTHVQVRAALPAAGTLLDVGCGAGAASLPSAARASKLIAVDESRGMLDKLTELASGVVEVEPVEGRWPEVADRVATVDVAICAHVAYNAPDLDVFLDALTTKARRTVVMELTSDHPQTRLSPLWERFWGLERPITPTADDAIAVVTEVIGTAPSVERWYPPQEMPSPHLRRAASLTRRLCLPPEREPDVEQALRDLGEPPPMQNVTVWWPRNQGA